jgi:pimeloyl-ACP methyl ester carboxylesterase
MRFRRTASVAPCLALVSGLTCGGNQGAGRDSRSPKLLRQSVTVEEIQFRHGDNLLAGSLYRPNLPRRRPAIAFDLGSGAQDRVYGGVGPALGQHFARNGFVCLVWDKPGVGKSTGDFNMQTFQDRAQEALAAVRFLCARPDVRADQVGLWGHSQGGMVVPLAASLSDQVAFVIQVSGWQGPAWRQDEAGLQPRPPQKPGLDRLRQQDVAQERDQEQRPVQGRQVDKA